MGDGIGRIGTVDEAVVAAMGPDEVLAAGAAAAAATVAGSSEAPPCDDASAGGDGGSDGGVETFGELSPWFVSPVPSDGVLTVAAPVKDAFVAFPCAPSLTAFASPLSCGCSFEAIDVIATCSVLRDAVSTGYKRIHVATGARRGG